MSAGVESVARVGQAARVHVPRWGWRLIAAKEYADHLLSARFIVLVLILGIAALVPVYFGSNQIRQLAPAATEDPALFLALFQLGSPDVGILRMEILMVWLVPLLGLSFSFDGVNGERAEGTLPRLLSQPIYRDDVINGKFAAGLSIIATVLVGLTVVVVGFGIIRLGIVPRGSELLRIAIWTVATILYAGFWLALGTLLSVVVRRAATSALIGFGLWVVTTIFGPILAPIVAGAFAPIRADASTAEQLANANLQDIIQKLLPANVYFDVSRVILDPSKVSVTRPSTVDQAIQQVQQIPTLFSVDQSLLLILPHIVALFGLTVLGFALAYVLFLRQEVRA